MSIGAFGLFRSVIIKLRRLAGSFKCKKKGITFEATSLFTLSQETIAPDDCLVRTAVIPNYSNLIILRFN